MTLDGATAVTAAAGPRTEARSPSPRLDGSKPDGKVEGRGEVAVIDGRGDSIRGGTSTPAGREDPVPKVDRADVPLDAAATAGAAGTIADRTPTTPASVELESGTRSEPAASGPPQQGETPTAAQDKGDGFGEHGWYSPADEAGSVFGWQDNTTVSTSGHASSAAAPSRTTDAPPEESSQSAAASSSKNEGEEQGGTDDNHWSERRKLVEDWEDYDEVWLSMRQEAKRAAEKEPLLVSFVYSTILNQKTLEAAVAFHLANKLAGPHMLSTQVQALVREYFADVGTPLRRTLRRDIIAVRERDPACDSYHDCLLYFKGFQALQTHRVAHWLYHTGRHALAFYLQSQVAQEFQIDLHPGAKFGEGVFIDHGTGIVVGETAVVGDDVSMLHRVTLGGSGVKSADRHPKIGNGVLIGAGACLLGNIKVGKGTQIGAGSLVATDLPERCVAVGVPAKVLGQGKKRKPALAMDQDCFKEVWGGKDI
ncbi:Serine O-acetyltransferase [Ectocarpus siliculosus]|uniref:serine O-acetyltransferase n=1 Tax=Ectocarpus siliculosus TaxID=2880 RepID=D7FYH8_ECTSI|nr:Serine O-acetyltransferase [Ectocarpus siliculosus]|eukprot:CBJ32520.1 Serine O-acetyltransferase [Ectocarpus siliculosus]